MKKRPDEIVIRQHEETEVPEVCGIPCSKFHVSLYSRDPVEVGLLYMKLGETWHRFFLDAGLLFWKEGPQPDPENDLVDGEDYVDWGQQLSVVGVALSEVAIDDSVFWMRFDNGAEIVLKHMPFDGVTSLLRLTPAD